MGGLSGEEMERRKEATVSEDICLVCRQPESDESHWTLILMPGGHRYVKANCVCLPDPNCPVHGGSK